MQVYKIITATEVIETTDIVYAQSFGIPIETLQREIEISTPFVDFSVQNNLDELICVANTSDEGATFTASIPNYSGTTNPLLIHVYFGAESYPNMNAATTINFGFGATPIFRGVGRFLEPNMLIATTITMSSIDGTYYYIPQDIGRLSYKDYYQKVQLNITGNATGTVINTGTILNQNLLGYGCVAQFRASTTANSGYRISSVPIKLLESNFIRDYIIIIPSTAVPTRVARIGLTPSVNIPSVVTQGVYLEINGLVIRGICQSTTQSITTTTYTLSNNTAYKFVIYGNVNNNVITFAVYDGETENLLWTSQINTTTSIPSSANIMIEMIQAVCSDLVANRVLLGVVNYGIGTIEGYNKLG